MLKTMILSALGLSLPLTPAMSADRLSSYPHQQPPCDDPDVVAVVRGTLQEAFTPYHVTILDVLNTRAGMYQGANGCLATVMTTAGPVPYAYFWTTIDGKIFTEILRTD